ncbi:hypothetical protein AbraIFM66950_006569 [Aspergillus brasiliensis]|nr:hypothetical protein AbraIFM66950_006569 [Aspergillus brasiliensis]
MDPAKYAGLDYASSGLLFVSCPHRASSIEELQDYIGTLLSLNSSYPSGSVQKIQQLAQSVHDTNIAFLETKFLIRSVICNILPFQAKAVPVKTITTNTHKNDSDDEDSDEEETNPESLVNLTDAAADTETLPNVLTSCCSYFGIPFELVYRAKLSYLEILQGQSHPEVEILSEDSFDKLRDALWAARRTDIIDSIQHNLALSQSPPLYPPPSVPLSMSMGDWYKSVTEPQYYRQYLKEHKGRAYINGVSEVRLISQLLSERLNRSENIPPLAPTLYFEFHRSDCRRNNIGAMLAYFIATIVSHFAREYREKYHDHMERIILLQGWSLEDRLLLLHSLIRPAASDHTGLTFMIGRLDQCDESRFWFLDIIKVFDSHPDYLHFYWIITSQGSQDIHTELSHWPTIDLENFLPESSPILSHPGPHDGSKDSTVALSNDSSTLNAVRPLSREETRTLKTLRQSDAYQEKHSGSWSPALGSSFTSHSDLASACIQYLCDPAVQWQMTEFCSRNIRIKWCPLSTDRRNLIAYATQYWPLHYRLAGAQRPFEQAIGLFVVPETRNTWSSMYYCLSNPATRLERAYLSPLPLTAMLGLDDLVREWIQREKTSATLDADCALALTEAARNGHFSTTQLLIETTEFKEPTLRDAISAAAAFGLGGSLQQLLDRALKIDKFQAPDLLLHRIAFLDMHETATALLSSNIDISHDTELLKASPLHFAANYGHLQTVKALVAAGADLTSKARYDRIPLHTAAFNGDPEIVRCLVDAGSDIEAVDEDDMTPLQVALSWQSFAAFELLLERGADPNHGKEGADDSSWNTKPLLYSSCSGMLDQVRLLLKHNADRDCSWGGLSPLYKAVEGGHIQVAELLLQRGADPNENPPGHDLLLVLAVSKDKHDMEMTRLLLQANALIDEENSASEWHTTALDEAAQSSHPGMIEYLLSQGASLEGKGSGCPLYIAAVCDKPDNVQALINAKAEVNQSPSFAEWKPIHASFKSPKCLQILLNNNADINSTAYGKTCLHLAVEQNQADTVDVLLKHQPKPDLEIPYPSSLDEDNGYTAVGLACNQGNYRIMKMLLTAGANKNHATEMGRRPIDICIRKGLSSAVKLLLQFRVTIDHVDKDGNTVLHHVSSITPKSVIRRLVDVGADVHIRNNKDATPLQSAVEAGNAAVIRYLLTKGADPNILVGEHSSLLHEACADQDLASTKALVDGGAGIGWAESHRGSLLGAALNCYIDPSQDLIQYLVETLSGNINGQGGPYGYPLLTACACGYDEQLRYLLEKGADPNVEDAAGHRTLHLACSLPVTKALEILLSFSLKLTENGGDPPTDKMGRTPIHYAASTGDWDLFHRVASFYHERELSRADKGGWTPFYWALMNPQANPRVIRYLIEHSSADIWARFHTRYQEWSPLKLGRFVGVSEEVLGLLFPASHERSFVTGIYYDCKYCDDYDLCFRCYSSLPDSHPTHGSDEDWNEVGPEFADNGEEDPAAASEASVPNESGGNVYNVGQDDMLGGSHDHSETESGDISDDIDDDDDADDDDDDDDDDDEVDYDNDDNDSDGDNEV